MFYLTNDEKTWSRICNRWGDYFIVKFENYFYCKIKTFYIIFSQFYNTNLEKYTQSQIMVIIWFPSHTVNVGFSVIEAWLTYISVFAYDRFQRSGSCVFITASSFFYWKFRKCIFLRKNIFVFLCMYKYIYKYIVHKFTSS